MKKKENTYEQKCTSPFHVYILHDVKEYVHCAVTLKKYYLSYISMLMIEVLSPNNSLKMR